jgi:FtsP/CotA-like multicopper oxidase with cupredoxin domain
MERKYSAIRRISFVLMARYPSFPGPLIRAFKGDTLRVTVKNKLACLRIF